MNNYWLPMYFGIYGNPESGCEIQDYLNRKLGMIRWPRLVKDVIEEEGNSV